MSAIIFALLYSLWLGLRNRAALHAEIPPPPSAFGSSTLEPFPQSTTWRRRSRPLGLALATLEWLAICSPHPQTGNGHRLAPAGVPAVLELEEPPSAGSTHNLS